MLVHDDVLDLQLRGPLTRFLLSTSDAAIGTERHITPAYT